MSHKFKFLSPSNVLAQEESQALLITIQKEPFNLAPYASLSLKMSPEKEKWRLLNK